MCYNSPVHDRRGGVFLHRTVIFSVMRHQNRVRPKISDMEFNMKIIIALSIVLLPRLAWAQTDVSGNQTGAWTAAASPYHVVGQIVVPIGQTLIIEPGVKVSFQGHYQFVVNGYLEAIGTVNDTIRFTTATPAVGWGGIRINSTDISQLSYCRIEYGKTAGAVYPDMHGGGLALFGSDAVISHCVFADNEALASNMGMGGAIYGVGTGSLGGPLTLITDCVFIRNQCYGEGGAIKFTGDMNTEITNCEFIQNHCQYGGGAISCYSTLGTKMTNCLFADNYTMFAAGGALHTLGSGNLMYIINCTFTGNSAVTGDGGAINLAYTQVFMVNTIVYDNPGMYSNDFHLDWGSLAEIHYSNLALPAGAAGAHNINVPPLFVDPANYDFGLMDTSPSVDTGTPYIVLNGETLVNLLPNQYCGAAPDMGAYEYCAVSGVGDLALPTFEVDQSYPNPFNAHTAIRYRVAADVFVSAKVFDVRGYEVRTLLETTQVAGSHSVFWDGFNNTGQKASQGLYFLRLRAGNDVRNVRMSLTK